MKVHYKKLYNMAHLSLNVFTASKGSNNNILSSHYENLTMQYKEIFKFVKKVFFSRKVLIFFLFFSKHRL